MEQLIIVGTSHISRESIRHVQNLIRTVKPAVVALELDLQRFYALTEKRKPGRLSLYSIRKIGLKGFLFALIGAWVSQRLGRMVGVEPGDEMKAAIKAAKAGHAKIALIDQDITITLARFSQGFGWRERGRLMLDMVRGVLFRDRELRRMGLEKFDLRTVPPQQVITRLMHLMRVRYPSLYRVFVDERNRVMAGALMVLCRQHPEEVIVAVVGAGHVEGIKKILHHEGPAISTQTPNTRN